MPQPTRPRIAFLAAGFIQWTGGLDFLRLCIGGIDSVLPGATWPVLVPHDTTSQRALACNPAPIRQSDGVFSVKAPRTNVLERVVRQLDGAPCRQRSVREERC